MNQRARSSEARFLLHAASIVVVIAGLRAAGPVLVPLFLAVFLSILCSPLLRRLLDWGCPKAIAVLATVLATLAVFAALVTLVSGSINSFTRSLPRYQTALEGKASEAITWLESRGIDTADLAWLTGPEVDSPPPGPLVDPAAGAPSNPQGDPLTDPLTGPADSEATSPVARTARLNLGAAVDLVAGTLRRVASLVSYFLIVMLMMIFILSEAPGLPDKLQRAFRWGEDPVGRLYKAREEIQIYLGIKTLISLATGAIITLWVWLLGVDYALLWGLVAFLLNYIPSLGSIIASIPAVLLTLVDQGPGRALLVAVGYLVVNAVLGNFAEPHLMGRKFGLSTLVVFMSLVFWGWVWGPVGMLLSVPLTMMLKILFENSKGLRWLAVLLGPDGRRPA